MEPVRHQALLLGAVTCRAAVGLPAPVVETSDDKGLAALRRKCEREHLVCERALALAAVAQGLTVAELPQQVLATKACFAIRTYAAMTSSALIHERALVTRRVRERVRHVSILIEVRETIHDEVGRHVRLALHLRSSARASGCRCARSGLASPRARLPNSQIWSGCQRSMTRAMTGRMGAMSIAPIATTAQTCVITPHRSSMLRSRVARSA
jgi:hypothetical protein